MIYAGIDAGSRTMKVVLYDACRRQIVAAALADQGIEQNALAERLLDGLLADSGLGRGDVGRTIATGYGRRLVRIADETVTEITCQAWGVRHCAADAATIIDIGGQDSKLVRLGPDGGVRDFVMNDRCAAGTGRFHEMLAAQLGIPLAALGDLARASRNPAIISSMCVVFAETEIVGLLAAGAASADIVAGVQASMATRIRAMSGHDLDGPVVFTGGVALLGGMDAALSAVLKTPVRVASQPQLTGALGAAILAARRAG